MSYCEIFQCDNCGTEIQCAFFFERDGVWQSTIDTGPPQEDESILCSRCYRRMNALSAAEQLKHIAPSLNAINDAGEFLPKVAEAAKKHYDALGEPYPGHLQSLIDFLAAKVPAW
jgi:hypothetical protein